MHALSEHFDLCECIKAYGPLVSLKSILVDYFNQNIRLTIFWNLVSFKKRRKNLGVNTFFNVTCISHTYLNIVSYANH